MYTMILLAALTNQIVIDAQQQGSVWTIVPQVMLTQDCDCQIQLEAVRKGASGNSNTRQRSQAHIISNKPFSLSRLAINVEPGDELTVLVTVSDGKSLNIKQQWSPPGVL
ncbi:curli assembly chaperone CsgC [Atlantibacter sp.]|uniref:curli assembly chaperone CsgC n=1 Tax=Atlantibacter sp. TaxID=1903473 RepID=UPI0013EFA6A3|nr:curli assembly chaperone CsgC [Atlantibacter sp.]